MAAAAADEASQVRAGPQLRAKCAIPLSAQARSQTGTSGVALQASTSGRSASSSSAPAVVGQLTRDDAPPAPSKQRTQLQQQQRGDLADALLAPLHSLLGVEDRSDLPPVEPILEPAPEVFVEPLPPKDLGTLQGGT